MGDFAVRACDVENRGRGLYTFPRVRYCEASASAAVGATSRGNGDRDRRRNGGSLRFGGDAVVAAFQDSGAVGSFMADWFLGKKDSNGQPHIEAVAPAAALPGGEVRIQ